MSLYKYLFTSIVFVCLIVFMQKYFAYSMLYSNQYLYFIYIFIVFILIFKLISRFLFPIIRLSKPTGYYDIGSVSYQLIDENRQETNSINSAEKRELIIQIWYPAKSQPGDAKSFYMSDLCKFAQKDLSKITSLPEIFFKDFFKIQTNTIENAKISTNERHYPTIIFSHGLGGVCGLNTANIEELVSHGYIVIGVNHTYSSYVTNFSDGRILYLDKKFRIPLKNIIKEDMKGQVDIIVQELEVWVQDVNFVLDQVERLNINKESFLFGKLDLNRLGIFGHSLGGALAAEMCRRDSRFKAGISLDGSVSDVTDWAVKKPFMFIVGTLLGNDLYPPNEKLNYFNISKIEWDLFINKYRKNILNLCNNIGDKAHYIVISGAGHFSFTDIALISLLINRYIKFDLGYINSEKITHISNYYITNFFDKYLKSKEINIPNKYFHEELQENNYYTYSPKLLYNKILNVLRSRFF